MEAPVIPAVNAPASDVRAEPLPGAQRPLRPALFAAFADLGDLRHDYPLVLIRKGERGNAVRPLTRIVNEILSACAPKGSDGEASRRRLLRLEAGIRRRVAAGRKGVLSDLWRRSAAELVKNAGEVPFGPTDSDLDRMREALAVDGPVIGCDEATPAAVLRQVWKTVHRDRARAFRHKVDGLILSLTDILKADYAKSDDAHEAENLRRSVGGSDADVLDFHALSRILVRQHPEESLPHERLRRIEWALLVLTSQRFYGPGRATERRPGQPEPHHHVFDSCSEALDALRARMPETLEFVKALTVAELEVENRYDAAVHDPVIEAFDESDLTREQMALFPTPLVCLRDGETGNAETVRAFEALASGLPFKVLIQTDDILGDPTPEPPRDAFGGGSARLASMAMGLSNAFALQVSSAFLYRLAGAIERGMRHDGPALFCVYSGATPTVPDVPPYLLSAAASESRAFPSFVFDPSAGIDWAKRFAVTGNPQPDRDWARHGFDYEDANGGRRHLEAAFGMADFVLGDTRYRRFCHPRPIDPAGEGGIPAADWLALPPGERDEREPWVPGIDADNRLYRVGLDEKVTSCASAALQSWQSLRELAGIGNSQPERALADTGAALVPDAPPTEDASAIPPPDATAQGASADESPAREASVGADDGPDDGAVWIETPRCTTCNECTQISNVIFAYNDDGQAYIADASGGTYRQIVEAAESCQVSIIHPGKPLDADEPDLDSLIERAAEFN